MTPGSSTQRLFDETFLRRLERMALVFHKAAASTSQGERRSSQRGQSIEFSDFRPYTLGDDFRRIDWNAYARLERLFIKFFVEEKDIVLQLLIDNSYSMNWGEPNKLSSAIRAAAAIGYIALVGQDRVTAAPLFKQNNGASQYFSPVRGKKSALQLFSQIQGITPVLDHQAPPEITTVSSSSILLFSDLMGDDWQRTVQRLIGKTRELTIVHILSPDEINPVLDGEFRLVDSENSQQVEITADFETIQRYSSQMQSWQEEWHAYCSARRVNYIPISSDLAIEDLLFAMLPRSGVLR